MKPSFRSLALLASLAICVSSAAAQTARFDFYARGPYRESVPRPQTITRYDVGDFHTNYATMERVINSIAQAAPERVRVFEMGLTNEYRMMRLLAISSPENIARLDEIKANVARLSDPRQTSGEEAQRIINGTPIIVWLAYTIHGNESASFETMMQVVYQLAASSEPTTLDVLKNCVVLVNVCENPDGHERFATWYNANGIGNPDPLAAEHREPWSVWGRANHYRFDLNRDNLVASQLETRHMQRAYLEWNPQVLVDHHGQTTQYFFPPAALPINPNLPSAPTARWLTAFGRANAAQFDARQWDYYVRDVFDIFYPGYWDSWPSLNGATGMTFETDAGGPRGYNWRRDDDTIITFRTGIAKHYVASLTVLETASQNRAARLNDYYEFKRGALEEGRSGPVRRFVILPGSDPVRAGELVDILLRSGVEVGVAREAFQSSRAHGYTAANAPAISRQFPAGAYVVDLAQPQKRLAKAFLEPETPLDEAFAREQLARFQRNQRRGTNADKEGYNFYDITAWSLPLAFGVEAYWTEDAGGTMTPLPRPTPAIEPNAVEAPENRNRMRVPDFVRAGGVAGGRANIAYIIPYERNSAASLAYRLQREDFKLAVAARPLNAGGRDWPRGTMVVRVSRNPETLHERIAQLARETGVDVFAVNSGFNETGETGIGGENVVSLRRPRIVVVADDPVSQTSYGALWWTLDRYGVDFTPMSIANLRRAGNLEQYNVIIMPDGSPGGYFTAFGKSGIDNLRDWISRGGTLVCLKGAAVFAALKDVNLTSSRLVGSDEDETRDKPADKPADKPDAQATPTPSPTPQGDQSGAGQRTRQPQSTAPPLSPEQQRDLSGQTEKLMGAPPDLPPIASPSAKPERVPEPVPGAIMRAAVDRSTPLTFGYEETHLPVLVDSAYFFRPSKQGTNAVVFAASDAQSLRIAGFIWPGNTERLLRGTSYVIDEPTGRGHVVLFAEDPNFCAIWRNATRMFFNSFLF